MNKKLSITIIVVLALTALVLSGCGLNVPTTVKSVVNEPGTLTVSGFGQVTLVPDLAYLNIGVHSEEAEVGKALKANNVIAQSISDALQNEGIAEEDIQTANFNVYPMQRYDSMGQITDTYFSVDNTVYVIVRDLSNLGKLLDVAINAGANNIYGINFDISNRAEALAQARDLAIKDAQSKAGLVASVAGVTLGEIRSINVSNASGYDPYYGGYGMGGGGASAEMSSVPVSSGQIILSFDATLTYAIK